MVSAIQITLGMKHQTDLHGHHKSKGFLFEAELKSAKNHILSILGTQNLSSQIAKMAI